MNAEWLQMLAQSFSAQILNASVAGVVLAALVWALLRLLERQNSRTRFVVWFCSLLTIAALPLLFSTRLSHFSSGNIHEPIALPGSWAAYFMIVWAIGSGISLLKLGAGLWRMHQLRRGFVEIDVTRLDPAIAGRLSQPEARRAVKIYQSADVSSPSAIGFLRPAIVFPSALLPQLSAEEFEVILRHELAHLRRWDDWTNLAQKIVKAVFFFHPAVWWIEKRLTLEREMACDDVVLAENASPKAYAAFLISFAEKLQRTRSLALVQGLIGRMNQMSVRVAQILDSRQTTRTAMRKPLLAAIAAVFVTALAAAPYAPRLVAFQSPQTYAMAPANQALNDAEYQTVSLNNETAIGGASLRPAAVADHVNAQAKVVPATFHEPVAKVTRRMKPTATQKAPLRRADALVKPLPARAIFVVLQSTEYDASGSAILRLSIWRFEAGSAGQLESAIALRI
jgi:beta-lactamase regulating signal transducer with metallopeptidase domain